MEVQPQYQDDADDLASIHVRSDQGKLVPLTSVVTMRPGLGPLSINHSGQLPSVTLSFTSARGSRSARRSPALRQIGAAVTVISDMNLQIASAAEEQSAVAEEINSNVATIRDVTESLSEQANESARVSQALNHLANQQQGLMDHFQV